MNILVAMKQTPDLTQVRISNRHPVFEGVEYTYGDLDKSALEAAVRMAEADENVHVTVVGVGDEELEESVKEALAAGAHDAVVVCDEGYDNFNGAGAAEMLAEVVKRVGDVDMVLLGEGSGDRFSGLMPGRLAEALGWPSVGCISSLSADKGRAQVTRTKDDVVETLEVPLPAVFSVGGEIATPRVPPISQILKAGRKPKDVLEFDDLDASPSESRIEIVSALAPENNREGAVLGSVEELMSLLNAKNLL